MFKNKVGRPSNKTIRKRKIIKFSIALFLVMVGVLLTYSLASIKPNKIKGEIEDKDKCTGKCSEFGFYDENFFNAVNSKYLDQTKDTDFNIETLDFDDYKSKISAIYGLEITDVSIKSIKGIEYLTNLEGLTIENGNLKNVDLNDNKSLTEVVLNNSNIETIDVSEIKNLRVLTLRNNNISQIDVSNNLKLQSLNIEYNNLENIDVSKNLDLRRLDVDFNHLKSIDVSNNLELAELEIAINNIKNINLENNKKLIELTLDYYLKKEVDVKNYPQLYRLEFYVASKVGSIIDLSEYKISELHYSEGKTVYNDSEKNMTIGEGIFFMNFNTELFGTENFNGVLFTGLGYDIEDYNGIFQKEDKYDINEKNIDVKNDKIEDVIKNIYVQDGYEISIIKDELFVFKKVDYDSRAINCVIDSYKLDNLFQEDIEPSTTVPTSDDKTTTTVKTTTKNNNPNTSDNIKGYFIILIIALVMGVGVLIYSIKNKKK